MERKIGEVFECDGVKLRVEPDVCMCRGCFFNSDFDKWCKQYKSIRGECQQSSRSDRGVIFKKVEDMKERAIKLTLDKAKEFYKKGGEFKDLALSAYTEKELKEIYLPKTWEEFCLLKDIQPGEAYFCQEDGDFRVCEQHNIKRGAYSSMMLPSLKDAEAHLALAQLHQLRDFYRNGWKPNYADYTCKYFLSKGSDRCIFVDWCRAIDHFLTFQTEEVAQEFLDNFKELIFKAWDLL